MLGLQGYKGEHAQVEAVGPIPKSGGGFLGNDSDPGGVEGTGRVNVSFGSSCTKGDYETHQSTDAVVQ
jgi:hypothetical protein